MPSEPLFTKVDTELDFPKEERKILAFWKKERIFEKTLAKPAPRGRFVFYEGPPTATGMPHNGHVLTRGIKDLFPRYKTMRGWTVPRKAGWDTHGLPVEVEVEKELHIHGKAAIEAYGVEPFVKKCIESVFRYTKEWEYNTERVAYWTDLENAYVTYHKSYVESVWWALGELFKKGLLYQGHKVVWWWAQGGTALSAGEVGQGYKTVDDPSVYVAFPLVGQDNLALLVWTTTPWTLPSNMYAAVHPEVDYVVARSTEHGKRYVIAKALLEPIATRIGALTIEREMKGRELVGRAYAPPFDLFAAEAVGWLGDALWTRRRGGLRHARCRHRHRPHRPGVRRRRPRGSPQTRSRASGPAPLLRGGARRHVRRPFRALRRPLGQGLRQRDCAHDLKDRGLLVHMRAIPPRLPILLAIRQRSAHSVRAPRLVHSHDAVHRPRHREQQRGAMGARARPRRTLWRFPREQRRLGLVTRALVGNAAQRVGVRRERGAQGSTLQHCGDRIA